MKTAPGGAADQNDWQDGFLFGRYSLAAVTAIASA